jgi:hypothetical protein
MRYIKYWDNQELDPIIKKRFNKSKSKRYMKAHFRRGAWNHRWSQLELVEMRRKFNEFIDSHNLFFWNKSDRYYIYIDECYENKLVYCYKTSRTAIRMYLFLRDCESGYYMIEYEDNRKFIEMLREFHDKLKCGREFGKYEEFDDEEEE